MRVGLCIIDESLAFIALFFGQKSHLFAFGAAVNGNLILRKPEYREFYLKNFQWAVLEGDLKWPNVESKPVSYEIYIYLLFIDLKEQSNWSVILIVRN